MQALLKTFPVVATIPVKWGDMDAFQHVNNVIYFRYFETYNVVALDYLMMTISLSLLLRRWEQKLRNKIPEH